MRGKRSKQYRKLMQQYALHFAFHEPYQVLLDAAILEDAYRFKMDFVGGLARALHGEIKPMITQCCIRHLYNAEPKNEELIEHAKSFERRRCGHHELDKPLSAMKCIASTVDSKGNKTNKHRYVVASQDDSLRAYLRTIPGVPMIYIKRSVMIMEPMAGVTESVTRKEEIIKFKSGLTGKRNPKNAQAEQKMDLPVEDGSSNDTPVREALSSVPNNMSQPAKKRRRGVSGPNPLSVKKAKLVSKPPTKTPIMNGPQEMPTDPSHKRKRRHKPMTSKTDSSMMEIAQ